MQKAELVNKIKGRLNKNNFLILLLMGILLLVIAWPVEEQTKTFTQSGQSDSESVKLGLQTQQTYGERESLTESEEEARTYAGELEAALEALLETVEGVGRVRVMVSLEDMGEAVVEKDAVTERSGSTEVDSAGGSRNTTDLSSSEETVFDHAGGEETPYIKKVYTPRISGVVVSAQGGKDPETIKNITEAIQALFGIEAHKIKIVKMIAQ